MTYELPRWEAAEIILDAYSKSKLGQILTPDAPCVVITELLTDLIHYCDIRNVGEDRKDVYFLDFDKMVKAAKTRART